LKLMLYMLILDIIELMCCSNSVSCFFSWWWPITESLLPFCLLGSLWCFT
jgi:hypothetical protein